MAIELICLDLDGTLLGPEKLVSKENMQALREAESAGLGLAIASGRHPFNVGELCREIRLPFTAVCLSGAVAFLDGREVSRCALDDAVAHDLSRLAKSLGCYISLAGSDFNLCAGDEHFRIFMSPV